jgi:hypothetical protein
MNTIAKILVALVIFLSGAGAHQFYMNAAGNQMVKLEKTRSGLFIIEQGKIYEVLELPTSQVSFQESYKSEK